MAKFYGPVGFAETVEKEPGLFVERVVAYPYFGDVIRNIHKNQSSGGVNDNINVSNEISIVSDPYAMRNFNAIRYVEFSGANWKVTDVEVQYPRLLLTMGGVYNGELAEPASEVNGTS